MSDEEMKDIERGSGEISLSTMYGVFVCIVIGWVCYNIF